jgi:hypothetical protein
MSIFRKLWDTVTDIGHGLTGLPTAKEKRSQQQIMTDQIKAYREQTAIAKAELERKRGEEAIEKRRINEKQIRSLRRNFRPSGFLDTGADVSKSLGA